jgi:hypothetical protein
MVYNQGQADQAKTILHKRVKDTGEVVIVPGYSYGPGNPPVSLVPVSPMTLEADLHRFGNTWRSLFGENPTKADIARVAKTLTDRQEKDFLALFEERLGKPKVMLTKTKATNGQDGPGLSDEGEYVPSTRPLRPERS